MLLCSSESIFYVTFPRSKMLVVGKSTLYYFSDFYLATNFWTIEGWEDKETEMSNYLFLQLKQTDTSQTPSSSTFQDKF